jgi:PAS domain S-box-containing protein
MAVHAGKTVESLQHKLEQCQRELEECRARVVQVEELFSHLADAIFVSDPDGRIVDVNPAACSLLGYSKQELLGLYPWDFVTSASRGDILQLINNMPRQTSVTVQRTYRSKAGEQKLMDLRMIRCDLAGRDLIIVSCRDVTEQKQLEARLRQSERNLAEGQRLTKTGSWTLDFRTGNTDWSVETCRIFGFPDPPPSPHYSDFRERVRPEDREGVDRGLRESFETGEPRPLKYIFVLPDGTRKNIETISQPVRDESGELKLMGTVMDVTERVKVEEMLREGEAHLRKVINTIPGLVWIARADGHIEYHNQRWIDYTGLTAEQAKGWGWRAAIHPEDLPALAAKWKSLLEAGAAGEGEARFRRFDGEYRWFLFRGVPLYDGSGRLVRWYGANTDIEELKQSQEALRASEKSARGQAEALSRTLDALARESAPDRIVEHVLRTITAQLDAHSTSVWLRDEKSGLMNFEFALDGSGFKTKSDRALASISPSLRIDDVWPWPEIFRTSRPYVLEDIREGPEFPWRAHVIAQGVITILIVPMLVGGQVEGVIGIRFTQKRAFRLEEMELAQALSHQAMLAMQLSRLSAQSRQAAVMAERNRMARDMHDTLAQGFTGVIMQLEAAKGAAAKEDSSGVTEHIERASDLARSSLGEARRSVRALRPRSLLSGTLCSALEDLLKRMTNGTALQAELVVEGENRMMRPDWEEDLLRITQEALTNTIKYAQASRFNAKLSFSAEAVELQLVDDGRGFNPKAEHDGFGLLGIRERVERMAGHFVIRSKTGEGTEIVITLNQPNATKVNHENDQA